MKTKLTLAARIGLGLIFTVFGLNGLVMFINGTGFIPMPPPDPKTLEVMGGLFKLSYLMPLVKILEVTGGVLLLLGVYKRLALVLLTPIVVNILGVHTFVDLAGLPLSLVIVGLTIYLIRSEWEAFSLLLEK